MRERERRGLWCDGFIVPCSRLKRSPLGGIASAGPFWLVSCDEQGLSSRSAHDIRVEVPLGVGDEVSLPGTSREIAVRARDLIRQVYGAGDKRF